MSLHSLLRTGIVKTFISNLGPREADDGCSLCFLLPRKVSQSTNIRLGNELESIFNIYVTNCTSAKDLRPQKKVKGDHQLDFARQVGTAIVYAEFKSNIELDTEKKKATINKIIAVGEKFRQSNPGIDVFPYLVSLRYLRARDVPPLLARSYGGVKLIGIAELFEDVLEHPVEELVDYDTYKKLLIAIVDKLEPPA
jgi:hypothetical protein